jgi:polyferredoxin
MTVDGTRQVVQYGLLAVFALLFITTSRALQLPINLSNLFSRFDPLQAIMSIIASREILPLYIPAIVTIVGTLVLGRVWCGWICPLGAILELFGPRGTRKMQAWFRGIKYGLLIMLFVMALFGSLAFMWLDPITILVRGVADPVSVVLSIVEVPGFKVGTLLSMLMLVLVLGLNSIEKRFWCRYLCPLGALIGLGSKFSWIRRRVNEASCVKCGDCVKTCPMGAIHPETIKNDPAECIMCMDCAAPCPKTAITFASAPPRWNHEFDPAARGCSAAPEAAVEIILLSLSCFGTERTTSSDRRVSRTASFGSIAFVAINASGVRNHALRSRVLDVLGFVLDARARTDAWVLPVRLQPLRADLPQRRDPQSHARAKAQAGDGHRPPRRAAVHQLHGVRKSLPDESHRAAEIYKEGRGQPYR